MNIGRVIQADCVNAPAPPDARCDDPAFRLNNPDICAEAPRLILKPGVVLLCHLGKVQFKAFLLKDGVEQDVSEDTIFSTSNGNVLVISAVSGSATGMGPGSATVTASYNGMTAYAEAEVLAGENCCDDISVAFMVLVDQTESMKQVFNSSYSSKLAFAKAAAEQFISEVNETKDLVGLIRFTDSNVTVLSSPVSDKDAVEAMVAGIAQTSQSTSYYDALSEAIDELNGVTANRRVLVLMTEGEDQTASYVDDDNPIALLDDFKNAGGIVICLGIRAAGAGYSLLSTFATGGFFVNAYDGNEESVLEYLSGIKGYICTGNCVPEGDEYEAKGELNYADFINWDVIDGFVDLQGNGFFDYLPGNGLYVDLISGLQPSGSANPVLRLKDGAMISVEAGKTYRLSVRLAGNQILDNPGTVRLTVESDDTTHLDQTVHINDYTQPFQSYSFSFVAVVDDTVRITIQQTGSTGLPTPDGLERGGVLLDSVAFENFTDGESLFVDEFNSENIVYVEPACGSGNTYAYLPALGGYGYAFGYNCYGNGCLTEPPPEQAQDPDPQGDIESGYTPPRSYTSQKTVCKSCPAGFINASDTPLAWSLVTSSNGPPKYSVHQLNNGAAVVRRFCVTASGVFGLQYNDLKFYGSNNGTTWTLLAAAPTSLPVFPGQTFCYLSESVTAYLYYKVEVSSISPDTSSPPFTLIGLNALYGVAPEQACATRTETSEISQADADQKAVTAATQAALEALNCMAVYTATESYTAKCSTDSDDPNSFGNDVTRSATRSSVNSLQEATTLASEAARAAALEALDCTLSNNQEQITINDSTGSFAKATPYPSVLYVEPTEELITKVTLRLIGYSHQFPPDVRMLLRSPAGTVVEFMRHSDGTPGSANAAVNLNIIFDDDAAGFMSFTAIVAGTFKPTQVGAALASFPSPAPQRPPDYDTTFAAFIGEDPSGSWTLWVVDDAPLDNGQVAGGWTLTISTA